MATILFHEIVFGPVHSRRMGTSLGMNLLPYDGKLCSFDCIYCECGLNKDFRTRTKLPDRENVRAALEDKLKSLRKEEAALDVITLPETASPPCILNLEGLLTTPSASVTITTPVQELAYFPTGCIWIKHKCSRH